MDTGLKKEIAQIISEVDIETVLAKEQAYYTEFTWAEGIVLDIINKYLLSRSRSDDSWDHGIKNPI